MESHELLVVVSTESVKSSASTFSGWLTASVRVSGTGQAHKSSLNPLIPFGYKRARCLAVARIRPGAPNFADKRSEGFTSPSGPIGPSSQFTHLRQIFVLLEVSQQSRAENNATTIHAGVVWCSSGESRWGSRFRSWCGTLIRERLDHCYRVHRTSQTLYSGPV